MGKSLDGLHPSLMRPRVEALLADPDMRDLGLYVVSAFRPIEHQARLFADAVRRYGSEAAARKWVAPPGRSNHGPRVDGFGTAVDLGIPGFPSVKGQWPADIEARVNAAAARHGLHSPMTWEDWHFEPIAGWTAPQEDDDMPWTDDDRADQKAIRKALESINHHISGDADAGARFPRLLRVLDAIRIRLGA